MPSGHRNKDAKICTYPLCHREMKSNGLCSGHAEQRRRGLRPAALKPVRGRYESLSRDEMGRKWCPKCEKWLKVGSFSASKCRLDGLYFHCKPCEKNIQLLDRYGISRLEFEGMLRRQGGRCAICKSTHPGVKGWCVDHKHECCGKNSACSKCVRGVLCNHCNIGIGLLKDSVENMIGAAIYLLGDGKKGAAEQDLRKVIWYIEKEIELGALTTPRKEINHENADH